MPPATADAAATDADLLAAFWRVVAAHGWTGVTMRRVAAESGQPLAALRRRFPSPLALLAAHLRAVDGEVLAGTVDDPTSTPRDRLFDVLMRRLDALQPHRPGILRFLEDLPRDPLTALWLGGRLPGAMAWMLEAADIPSAGGPGLARAHGLAAVWLSTLRAWSRDDSQDLSASMAALDRALDRADRAARLLRLDAGAADPAPGMQPDAS
ncbi:MAG: TetR family transcriptional regulator [Acetobacteraceae bacterium]|nr:TetR family transcriptional regulator [Acetobacteraceae bacterium]